MSTIKQRFVALIGGLVLGLVPLVMVPAHADTSNIAVDDTFGPFWVGQLVTVDPLVNDDASAGALTLETASSSTIDVQVYVNGNSLTINVVGWNTSVAYITYSVSNGSWTDVAVISVSVAKPLKPRIKKVKRDGVAKPCKLDVTNRNTVPIKFGWRYLDTKAAYVKKIRINPGATKRICVHRSVIEWSGAILVPEEIWVLSGRVFNIKQKKR